MNEQQIQSLIDLGKTLAAVIFGYLLAVFKEWLNRNRLRYSMIKQLWHEIANFELKPFDERISHIMTPYRSSTIDHILLLGVLSDGKYHGLLMEILELRGWWYNSNTVIDLANKRYAIVGDNQNFNEDLSAFKIRTFEQTVKVRQEIKRLFPNIDK